MQRQPAVAGQFYPGSAKQLELSLAALIPENTSKKKVTGIISPHAGYIYSGGIAGKLFSMIQIPQTVLIVGPNHTGAGAPAALYPDGEWLTPLGAVPVNQRFNALLLQNVPYLQQDSVAHKHEHSLEVQLPFIRYLRPDVSISAICLGHGDFDVLAEIGSGLATAIRAYGEDVLIVASSDMTHYESSDTVRYKDELALARVIAFDPEGLLETCRGQDITMCGVAPSVAMLVAAGELGAGAAEVVAYGNSGDVSGDKQKVVGYAAVTVF